MTEHTPPSTGDDAAAPDGSPRHGFETPEGLRALLIRLHEAGPGAWRRDREAAELMRYTAERYRRLARKYGLDEWEVASGAFEVMLAPSTRNADNPWAVVTRAMKITCGVEVRAAGMLVSPSKMRHMSRFTGFHDAIRFAERENLADYHPAFAVNPTTDEQEDFDGSDRARVAAVLSEIVGLFASAGWDAVLVTDCIEHVAYRFSDLTSRSNAVEVLRRDRAISTLLGIPPRSWAALLRIVLGHPDRKHAGTATGDGVLLRLLSGEPLDSLRCDTGLMAAIWAANPDKQTEP
ncbi:exopolyphosphatase [Auritidibacter ignavus]|uniref:exopolyphosphatase n=1 Tax=Auritidibacter ignavus TaxID=678932 RepID=UPI0024B909EE|nr:exopolyphosphatase [Auritidibacter ignavus]WHS28103.1 exopolyphosphatase [Auritidibacter ignavus]